MTRRILPLLLLALLAGGASAQPAPVLERQPGAVHQMAFHEGRAVAIEEVDLAEEVRLIVQFTEPPLARVEEPGARLAARGAAMSQHARFRADLAALAGGAPRAAAVQIEREFATAINGAAVTVPRGLVGHIRSLDYVLRADENRPVRASGAATGSMPAPAGSWSASTTGEGIVIAVIDTGVDYLHPALGGGIGPAFKVIGGFDFINGTANPMDDNGHGTHVAGIAAASGAGFSGVAPGARILAYKVLDAGGFGDMAAVIAGIEAAMDPNGDGVFTDRADVINLSLGGDGDADDPLATAADNAALVGSVVVVAAGNQGDYQTIGSPAAARLALTVGAHDAQLAIAPFSSRGPAGGSFALKPDLLAPGVDIASTWPGGGFATHSGTSMAAPYAAGLAALIRAQRPAMPAAAVKAALMNTAVTIGEDVYTQGAGRVDGPAALAAAVTATPSFGFGLVDSAVPVWTASRPLALRNDSGTARTFTLTTAGALPAGATVTVSPSSVTVPAGGVVTATVTASVVNAQVPFGPLVPPSLVGEVVAQSAAGTLRMPFAMVKASHVRVTWEDEFSKLWFIGQDSPHVSDAPAPAASGGIVLIPPGTYTVAAHYPRWGEQGAEFVMHVKEQVVVPGTPPLDFRRSDVTARVRFVGRTHTNAPADVYMIDYLVALPGAGGGLSIGANLENDRFFASPITGATIQAASFANVASGDDYVAHHHRTGNITGQIDLAADPAAYRRTDLHYIPPTGADVLVRAPGRVFVWDGDAYTLFAHVFTNEERFHLQAPFRQSRYIAEAPAGSPYYGFSEYVTRFDGANWPGLDESLHAAPLLAVTDGATVVHHGGLPSSPAYATTASPHKITVGLAPPMWFGAIRRASGGMLRVEPGLSDGAFLDASFGRPGGMVTYEAFSGGQLVATGGGANTWLTWASIHAPAPARLRLRHEGHRVLELDGRAMVDLSFDARPGDLSPPRLSGLQLRSDGVPTVALPEGATNVIHLALADQHPSGPVAVEVQRLASGEWVPLATAHGPGPHEVAVPPTLSPGYYGLRVRAEDAPAGTAANVMDLRSDVAFAYRPRPLAENATPTTPHLVSPAHDVTLDPATVGAVAFAWTLSTDADPADLLSYALRVWGPGLDTTATVWDGAAATLDLTGRLQELGVYQWTVTASDGFAVVPSSSTFRILTPGAVGGEPGAAPAPLALLQSFPNPTAGAATIGFVLPRETHARLAVFDLLGRRVATLADGVLPAGRHDVAWDAAGAASGAYVYRLEAAGEVLTRRLTLVRR